MEVEPATPHKTTVPSLRVAAVIDQQGIHPAPLWAQAKVELQLVRMRWTSGSLEAAGVRLATIPAAAPAGAAALAAGLLLYPLALYGRRRRRLQLSLVEKQVSLWRL